MLVTVIVGN